MGSNGEVIDNWDFRSHHPDDPIKPDREVSSIPDLSESLRLNSDLTAACPDTTVTKKPKRTSTRNRAKVTIKFIASLAGSTFECRLDGHRKWKPCTSPYKRRLGVGKHTLQIRAVSPAGVADPKPARAKFTIRRS